MEKYLKGLTNRFIKWLTVEDANHGLPLSDFNRIRYELRPGDVVLVEGRSRVSEVIKGITQSSWSHAALYIGRLVDIDDPAQRRLVAEQVDGPPNTPLIIEGVMGKGTVVSPLAIYKDEHLRVCRPRGLSHQDAQNVIAFAIAKLGTPYNVRQIMDLLRFLMPWTIMPRRYRSSLFATNIGHSSKTVCSSMLAEAFNSVEFPILPLVKKTAANGIELIRRNPKIHTPRDFDYSPYFDIIKYPFIELADAATYRQLPWNRQGLMSNDYLGIVEEKQTASFQGVTDGYHEPGKAKSEGRLNKASSTLASAELKKASRLMPFKLLNFKNKKSSASDPTDPPKPED